MRHLLLKCPLNYSAAIFPIFEYLLLMNALSALDTHPSFFSLAARIHIHTQKRMLCPHLHHNVSVSICQTTVVRNCFAETVSP